MTHQEFIDTFVATYVAHPENRSVDEDNFCMYRSEGGQRCAIGMYIPDEEYEVRMEDLTVSDSLIMSVLPESVSRLGTLFLRSMQLLHDTKIYWTKTGLSKTGLYHLEYIKQLYLPT